MSRRWWAFGVTAVALVAMAGCGGGEAAEPPPTEPPTTEAAPPPTVLSDEDAVLAAYQGYWDTWLAANDPPNPDHPDLAKYATGGALAKDIATIADHRQLNQAVVLPESPQWSHQADVVSVGVDQAVVLDCAVDDSVLVDRPSGRILNDAVGTFAFRASLSFQDGSWKVVRLDMDDRWEGVAGCAA